MFWIKINKTYIPVFMLHVINFCRMQESDCDLYLNIIYVCKTYIVRSVNVGHITGKWNASILPMHTSWFVSDLVENQIKQFVMITTLFKHYMHVLDIDRTF